MVTTDHANKVHAARTADQMVLTINTNDLPKLLEVLYLQATRHKEPLKDVDVFLEQVRRSDADKISSIDGFPLGVTVPIKGNLYSRDRTTVDMTHLFAAGVSLDTINQALIKEGVETMWGSSRISGR